MGERYLIEWEGRGRRCRSVVTADSPQHAQFQVYSWEQHIKGGSSAVTVTLMSTLYMAAKHRAVALVTTTKAPHVVREESIGGYAVFQQWKETLNGSDEFGRIVAVCAIGSDGNPGFHEV